MRYLLTIGLFLGYLTALGQNEIDLKIRKKLRDRLDDLVFGYEQFSRFSSSDEITNYKRMFEPDAMVFDYLTPNYVTRNNGQELVKEIDDFIADVRSDYPSGLLQSRITDTNLGEAIDYDQINWSDPLVSVLIRIRTVGEYVDGGQLSNDAILSLSISFDTLAGTVSELRIRNVNKVSAELRYQKQERAPAFEKMIQAKAFQTWNHLTGNSFNGDFYVSDPVATADISQSYGFNLIKILSAPEPEEFAFSIGVNYMTSNYGIESDDFFYSYLTTDRENDAVYRNVTGESISENVRSELIEIPILFRYERKFSRVFSFFINPGLSLNYHFKSYHSGSGTFSYSGYYPKYDLIVTDVEEYGFLSDQQMEGSFDIIANQFSRDYFGLNGTLEGGINLENKNGWVFYIGAHIFKGIVDNNRITDFNYVTTDINDYNGLYPVINRINFGGYGFLIGIRKRFRSRNGLVKMIDN